MLVIGLVLILIAIVGVIWGLLNIKSTSYSNYFASPGEVDTICQKHIKPVGTSPGTECGILVQDESGKSVSCRKGFVNSIGNECAAKADHVGPGLIAGSALVLLAGIVCCFIRTPKTKDSKSHKKS